MVVLAADGDPVLKASRLEEGSAAELFDRHDRTGARDDCGA